MGTNRPDSAMAGLGPFLGHVQCLSSSFYCFHASIVFCIFFIHCRSSTANRTPININAVNTINSLRDNEGKQKDSDTMMKKRGRRKILNESINVIPMQLLGL